MRLGLEGTIFHIGLEVMVVQGEPDEGESDEWVWRVLVKLPPDSGWDKGVILAADTAPTEEAAQRQGERARKAIAQKLGRVVL